MLSMEWAWLIPTISFLAFPVIISLRRTVPMASALVAILAILAGFVVFWLVTIDRIDHGATGIDFFSYKWFEVGSVQLTWGIIVDPLTIVMLGLVTFVALMVQVYSIGYMRGDSRFGWYFALHSLFAASMLTVVLADNFLLLYIAWELVGLCSYLLIGFWYELRSASEAAKKAFITTRIADVALLIGILLLFKEVGTFSMQETFHQAELLMSGAPSALSSTTATASAILLFVGAMGKSAQFPFHVWLPDAMEGPTPVSALIHAATMVVAGVFLVARTFTLFEAAPNALLVVAIVGLTTTLIAATMALVATDLKRILAYSTISHLGLMMLSLGAFGYTAAIFHLLAHGFSKALLFLGAGSVMHGANQTDVRNMGGLIKVMPFTAILFGIGALSLGGVPIFAGFWSKDEILISVLDHRHPIFIALLLVAVFLSALYMARAYFIAFLGDLKDENRTAHEASSIMLIPMISLGILALTFGFMALEWTNEYSGIGSFLYMHKPHGFEFNVALGIGSIAIAIGAFVLAWLIYRAKVISIERLKQNLNPLISVIERKYYLDDIYQWTIDRVVLVFSGFIGYFDRIAINDIAVDGSADSIKLSAYNLRYHITGLMQNYALGMIIGAVGVAVAWWAIAVYG
ncbi:NADH-quinone oxidoreductase subunit L [SAR202 cluster bacterium AD-804-J14_MRT_500m]|nr:NADH-quinone oxidoreductase subunit L [SAR202 cluster bacterium AD-804-J14_MRT_500m]